MKNRTILIIVICCLTCMSIKSQTAKVKGSITTLDTAVLTILNIYPDSFPNVSVVFRAERNNGEPVWNLTKEKMKVKENRQNCEVVSLEKISKVKPIHIGIVIDHSGSMGNVERINWLRRSNELLKKEELPTDTLTAIDKAKAAVKTFVSRFNFKKDFISIIGFSTQVTEILPLTQDIGVINKIVDGMRIGHTTALYDAMLAGLEQVSKANGIKILVALTDGQDNTSKYKWTDVVNKANKEEIPIYLIGLGFVNIDTLRLIAESTKGKFYYIKTASSLSEIYSLISKQMQAFYNLVYLSPNILAADTIRKVEITFDTDSLYLISNASEFRLSKEVIEYVAKKEKQREYMLYSGIALAIIVSAGTLLFFFKRKRKPIIKNLYPNPTSGRININFKNTTGQLQIKNYAGQTVKTIEITGTEKELDLSELSDGNYIAIIYTGTQKSNAFKFVIQK